MNDLIPSFRAEGEVLFEGENLYDKSVDPVEVRRRIGMVFQKPNPFPKSIFDNVAFGAADQRLQAASMDEIVEQALQAGGPLGRRQGQAQAERAGPFRWSAAAPLHRPRPRRRAGSDPHGRALLRP